MNQTPQYLNQYTGYDANNVATVVVAQDMETAVQVYVQQREEDPVQMQTTKKQIFCVLPDTSTTFTTSVFDTTGGAVTAGCKAYPTSGTVTGGTKQFFQAVAAEGWEFVKWQIDGVDVEDATEAIMQLTIPTKSSGVCTVRAVFQEEA